jgi:hypothetical protein
MATHWAFNTADSPNGPQGPKPRPDREEAGWGPNHGDGWGWPPAGTRLFPEHRAPEKDPDDCLIAGFIQQNSFDLELPSSLPRSESPHADWPEMQGWGRIDYIRNLPWILSQWHRGAAKDPDDLMPSGGIGRKRKHFEMEYKYYK